MRIGIDIGGSHIGIGLVDEEELIVHIDKNFTEEDQEDKKDAILKYIDELIETILEENDLKIDEIEMIGIASPGTISNGIIVKSGNLGIRDFDIISELKKKYQVPLQIKNDGKCAALAEKRIGAMKGYDDCLFINIGTGIGGAAFIGGKLLEPKRYSGFEFGHMIVEKDGIQCTCGKRGCFERYCSIKALKDRITTTLEIENKDISGQYMREELMVKYPNEVRKDIVDFLEYLVIGIGNLIDIFEPEIICFGGSLSYYEGHPVLEEFKERLNKKNTTFNNGIRPQIVTAAFRNNAGIIGATIKN